MAPSDPGWSTAQEPSLTQRLVSGSLWNLAGTGISKAISPLFVIGVARELGAVTFGELCVVQASIGMFGAFATFGMAQTLTKHIPEFRREDPAKTGRILALSIWATLAMSMSLGGVFFLLAPYVSGTILNNVSLSSVLQVAAVLLVLQSLVQVQVGMLSGFEAFRSLSFSLSSQSLLCGLATFIGAVFGGLLGAILGNVIALLIVMLINARLIRIESDRIRIPIRLQGCLQELPILYRFSMPVALGGLVSAPMRWLCSVILVNTPQGYFYAGLYYASFRLRSLFQVLGDAISHCILPLMASPEGYKNTTLQRANFLVVWLLGVVLTLPILAFPEVFAWLFGSGFSGEQFTQTTILVALTLNVYHVQQAIFRTLITQGRVWFRFIYLAILGLVLVSAVYLLSPYGAVGYAAAFLLSKLVVLIGFTICLKQHLIPKNSILTKESFTIWLSLAAVSATSLFVTDWTCRIGVFAFFTGLISRSIYVLLKKTRGDRVNHQLPDLGNANAPCT